MLDSLNTIFSGGAEAAVSMTEVAFSMGMAVLLGAIIAGTYLFANRNAENRKSLAITLLMLPVILAVIILFVGSNVARAFSLAGTMSIVRFRSAPGEPKDIGYIFFATAAGLACGVEFYGGAILFTVLLSIIMLIVESLHIGGSAPLQKLKVTIPEDLNYSNAFSDVFDRFADYSKLSKVKTTELGSLFEVHYDVRLRKDADEKAFIDEIRSRNGNLTVMLSLA